MRPSHDPIHGTNVPSGSAASAETAPVQAIRELGGADAAVVLAVGPSVFDQAFQALNRGGRLVLVSLPAYGVITLPIFDTVLKGISVIGSIVGTRQDLAEVLACTRPDELASSPRLASSTR